MSQQSLFKKFAFELRKNLPTELAAVKAELVTR